jgi:aminoglycoside phosphotransferase (APT) family kinase protein
MKSDPKLDIKKVTSALLARMPEYLGPWHEEKTKHGQSNPTFILQGKAKTLVLRRKPDGELLRSAHMVEREYRVMSALYDTPVPVPKVFYLCNDPTEIGSIYFIMEYMTGITFSEPSIPNLSVDERKRVYDNMNAGLVALEITLNANYRPGHGNLKTV